ncbi:MAG: bifunctional folylpolyglutamate synthase/dihydrofolate synthase [Sphaerochaetaceae bacterium]|nr:bifunctional folylpolyglutamate synthase/dihydrofolate synthase [Sphaerochaetaceae bacterium]
MVFKKLSDIESFMNSFTNLEKKTDQFNVRTYRLDRMKAFMDSLGNPQNSYKTIHVAGSKGKGSTAAFLANALTANGEKTGLFMSPHVTDFRERFTLSGAFIEDSILLKTADRLTESLKTFRFSEDLGYGTPTTFELYTAYAFMLFKECKCTYAVIETGLGGRLDATNILHPIASVLTPIELEHTAILGDTIEKIAVEKSKIIKKNTPAFTACQKDEAQKVFEEEARECNSTLYSLSSSVSSLKSRWEDGVQKCTMVFSKPYEDTVELKLAMPGEVQAYNCALALLTLKTLGLYKKGTTEKGLESTKLPGRAEIIKWKRTIMLDGAHTDRSMENILKTFREIYGKKKGLCIFGCAHDKDYRGMLDMIVKDFDKIVISRPGTFKKSDLNALFTYLESIKTENQVTALREEGREALKYVLENTDKNDPVLVCGSFYLAGEIKESLECL